MNKKNHKNQLLEDQVLRIAPQILELLKSVHQVELENFTIFFLWETG